MASVRCTIHPWRVRWREKETNVFARRAKGRVTKKRTAPTTKGEVYTGHSCDGMPVERTNPVTQRRERHTAVITISFMGERERRKEERGGEEEKRGRKKSDKTRKRAQKV